jgi:ribosomal protein L7Ae-like RNA K-turn-binding protein
VIKRLVEIAEVKGIAYSPSYESCAVLNDYCNRKGIPVSFVNS